MTVSRIGLIGLGKHGRRYVKHIRQDFPHLTLTAVCRADPRLLAEDAAALGARGFVDFRDLLRSGLCDAAIAVVPPDLHPAIVEECCAQGVPLLLEKPAATDVDGARQLQRTVAAAPIPLMVAQTLRYNAVIRAIVQKRAEIGSITSLSLTQRFEPTRLAWLDDPARAGAGIVLHTGVHCFDLIHHLTGLRARAVTAQVSRINTLRTEDNCAATVQLDGGVLATVSLARTTTGRTGHVELAGETGAIAGDHVLNYCHIVRGTEAKPVPIGGAIPTVREIVGDFVASIDGGLPMPIPLMDGLRAVAVAAACLESARSGRTVEVPDLA